MSLPVTEILQKVLVRFIVAQAIAHVDRPHAVWGIGIAGWRALQRAAANFSSTGPARELPLGARLSAEADSGTLKRR
jgi:hypothetical protein